IRFKGFTDDWEQRKLGDIFNFQYGEFNNNPDNGGKYPIYGANGIIGGYSTFNAENSSVIGHMGAYAGNVVWAEGKHFVTYNGTIARPSNTFLSSKFGYYLLCYKQIYRICAGSGQPFVSYSDLNKIKIRLPLKKEEQLKIENYLTVLDNLITLHQRKLENVQNIKKSCLQKMFPKNGENLPEVRFPEFSGAWEQRKLGEIGIAKSGVGFPESEQGGIEGIPFFKVSDMNTAGNENELVVANNYVTEEQIKKKRWNVISDTPAIFFAKVGAAVMLNRKRFIRTPFLLDNNTMTYIFNKDIWNCDFGKTLFETIDLTKLTQIGALPSYNASDVENIEIKLPKLDEQKKIGEFFSKLDNLITLHQRKLENLQNIKKGLLQQMFI
ncbi:MAG: restriction endonuclease subunit S, partial [Succinatimonas sp.]|nr:restriction endonuclease subunit S [Succinatimonas sp.]